MANTKIIDDSAVSATSSGTQVTGPCAVHIFNLAAGETVVVESAPNNVEAEYVPAGKEAVFTHPSGGVVCLAMQSTAVYWVRAKYQRNASRPAALGNVTVTLIV